MEKKSVSEALDPSLTKTFSESIEPAYLIPLLSRLSRQTIVTGKTLIVFDEVQLCERALTSLKYFCEQAKDYHIVASGSLLGIAVNRQEYSFPVGKVDIKTLYPMDMEEFLLAFQEDELVREIRECYEEDKPLPAILHDQALEYYRQYLLVGGMPECVKQYTETKDFTLIRNTQKIILASYLNDMSKYNTNHEIKKTRLVYGSTTVQLSKKTLSFSINW